MFLSCLLHQTTTLRGETFANALLFLSCLLHQTTTSAGFFRPVFGCFSLVFYIKPQLCIVAVSWSSVVSLLSSTSNHNYGTDGHRFRPVVSLLSSTSNHNVRLVVTTSRPVVSLLSSTSNHNHSCIHSKLELLFLSCLLHQTTTIMPFSFRCPSLFLSCLLHQTTTVVSVVLILPQLFLSCLLHQTTTYVT